MRTINMTARELDTLIYLMDIGIEHEIKRICNREYVEFTHEDQDFLKQMGASL
jgi:hypothetical protein